MFDAFRENGLRYGSLLCKSSEVHILKLDFASLIDILRLLIVEDIGILDGNVVNHSLSAMSYDAVLASFSFYVVTFVISFSEYVKRRL